MAIISFFRIIFNYDFIVTKEFLVPYLITTIIYAFIIMFVYELSNVFVKKVRHQGRILTFYETTPFAIFLFIGTLLTIVCSGNILLFFRSLF